jgi:hypothetical protein
MEFEIASEFSLHANLRRARCKREAVYVSRNLDQTEGRTGCSKLSNSLASAKAFDQVKIDLAKLIN